MARFQLSTAAGRLQLIERGRRQKPLAIDFNSSRLRYRQHHGGKKELLLRAVAADAARQVVDCTAGLGVDAYLMAASGCSVTLLERSPLLALMLAEALASPVDDPDGAAAVARMQVVHADAVDWLQRQQSALDTLYIDQMFPHRQKSAAVKGNMQMLQRFLGDDGQVAGLLAAALAVPCRRVVVKRPLVGGETPGYQPDYQLKASASRFDVYLGSLA